MPGDARFGPELFEFLQELGQNNTREWFNGNKARYEDDVRGPVLSFISDFGPLLHGISERFEAIPSCAKSRPSPLGTQITPLLGGH
jgi:uncharacterized protein (DUF2461 family)